MKSDKRSPSYHISQIKLLHARLPEGHLTLIKEKLWKMMHLPVELQARYFNSVIRGHFNYFGILGNGSSLVRFRSMVMELWRRMLSRRSQVSKVSWGEMDKLQEQLKIVPMKIRIPYGKLSSFIV